MAIARHTGTPAVSGCLNTVISGRVTSDQQALVAVDIFDGDGRPRSVEVILDTGFTGYLTLPQESIIHLGLPSVGQRTFELANGELFDFQVYLGSVSWHGRPSDVVVLQSDGAPLLGMALLWGSRVTMDALSDGEVGIEELPPTQ